MNSDAGAVARKEKTLEVFDSEGLFLLRFREF